MVICKVLKQVLLVGLFSEHGCLWHVFWWELFFSNSLFILFFVLQFRIVQFVLDFKLEFNTVTRILRKIHAI